MMTYLNPSQWRPIVSSIDLISPPGKMLKLSCLDLKSTPKHGNSIPLPHCTAVRGYEIFHDISMGFGDYLCSWRLFVPRHTTQNFHIWISKGQDQSAVLQREAIDLSEGQGHIPYMGKACAFEGQGWSSDTPCLHSFYSFILIWNLEKSHQICAECFGKCIFTKLIPKVNGKTFGIQLKNTVFYGHK